MTIALSPVHASSPLRPSPLGQSALKAQRQRPQPIPTSPTHRRTPSDASDETPVSRSQSLLGSYPLSLLHARMSAAPHANTAFELHMKAVAIGKCDPDHRAPRALTLPFTARCYDLGERQSPWVGDVDVEKHFFDTYADHEGPAELGSPSPSPRGSSSPVTPFLDASEHTPPSYPGYRVPAVGQLQLLIKTPSQAVKAFILPYDLSAVPVGGRLLARERTYVGRPSTPPSCLGSPSPSPQKAGECLRFAVQLQFVCTRSPATKRREYHVSRSVKLVFAAGPGCSDYEGESRIERHDEIVPPTEKRRRSSLVPSAEAARRRSLLASSPGSPLDMPQRRRSLLASSPESPVQRRRSVAYSLEIGSPRQSLGQTLESWAAVRDDWSARAERQKAEQMERQKSEEERPKLRRKPTRLEGFEPPPARPTSPSPPMARPSLLSALRAASPAPQAAPSPFSSSASSDEARVPLTPKKHQPALDRRATPPISPHRRTSAVDRELSELLRATHL